MNLLEAWKLYEQDKTIEGYSKATMKLYRTQTNQLYKHFGETDIEEITLADLKNYIIERCGHLKPASVGGRIRFIRAFFR